MRTLILLIFLLPNLVFATVLKSDNADSGTVDLSSCYDVQRNTYGYERCVNHNFSQLREKYDLFLDPCLGLRNNHRGFERCMNFNFGELEHARNLSLWYCTNIDGNPYGYERCVNDNFNLIQAQEEPSPDTE